MRLIVFYPLQLLDGFVFAGLTFLFFVNVVVKHDVVLVSLHDFGLLAVKEHLANELLLSFFLHQTFRGSSFMFKLHFLLLLSLFFSLQLAILLFVALHPGMGLNEPFAEPYFVSIKLVFFKFKVCGVCIPIFQCWLFFRRLGCLIGDIFVQ